MQKRPNSLPQFSDEVITDWSNGLPLPCAGEPPSFSGMQATFLGVIDNEIVCRIIKKWVFVECGYKEGE